MSASDTWRLSLMAGWSRIQRRSGKRNADYGACIDSSLAAAAVGWQRPAA